MTAKTLEKKRWNIHLGDTFKIAKLHTRLNHEQKHVYDHVEFMKATIIELPHESNNNTFLCRREDGYVWRESFWMGLEVYSC